MAYAVNIPTSLDWWQIKTLNGPEINMDFLSTRLETFNTWPIGIKQRPEELAESGLFYSGNGDLLVCFACGIKLKDWKPEDDVWKKHFWETSCWYIREMKDENWIRETCLSHPVLCLVYDSDEDDLNTENKVEVPKPDKPKSDDNNCIICLDKERDAVFIPCGHLVCCMFCAVLFQNCPYCRRNVDRPMKVFM